MLILLVEARHFDLVIPHIHQAKASEFRGTRSAIKKGRYLKLWDRNGMNENISLAC
jgi:hypothetical protein